MSEVTVNDALRFGISAHELGNLEDAVLNYRIVLKIQPEHPTVNHKMGSIASEMGNYEDALQFFKTAVESKSDVALFWISLVEVLIKLKRFKDARNVLDHAKNRHFQGESFEILEQQLEYNSSAKHALSKIENPPQHQLQQLTDLYNKADYQKALAVTHELLESFPISAVLYNICGAVKFELKQFDEAFESYKKALEIKPDYVDAHYNMGKVLSAQKKPDAALESYKRAIEIKPDYVDAHYNMGTVFYDIGNLGSALESYTQTIKLKPDFAEAHNNMGIIYQDLGEFESALESYRKAIAIQPNYIDAKLNTVSVLKIFRRTTGILRWLKWTKKLKK